MNFEFQFAACVSGDCFVHLDGNCLSNLFPICKSYPDYCVLSLTLLVVMVSVFTLASEMQRKMGIYVDVPVYWRMEMAF